MQYQSTPEDRRRAILIGVIYVILAAVLGIMLFKIWPPIPWPAPKDAEDSAKLTAFLKEVSCPTPTPTASPSPTATPTPTPTPAPASGTANSNQNTNTTSGTNTRQAGTPTPAGTRPPAGQTGAQATGQPGATNAGNQPPGGTQTNPQPPAGSSSPDTAKTDAAAEPVVDRSGEIIIIGTSVFGQCLRTTFDERLLLLVIVAGMLGAFVHGATSLADYIGNNNFNRNWTWFYLLRPAIGMSLALVFYFVIRGGFLSTTGGAADINPYGIAALAGLVGMFSKQATDKLGEVFGTLFRSAPGEGDAKRKDPLQAPTGAAIQLEPLSAVAGGEGFKITVSGAGFVDGAAIHVDDVAQTTTFESANKLSAQIPKEKIASAATLKISVVNPDKTKFGPVDLVVSPTDAGAAGATEETPVHGEETGDPEEIDGCDVDMKADTPDEDLPITKGGVD